MDGARVKQAGCRCHGSDTETCREFSHRVERRQWDTDGKVKKMTFRS